MIERIKGLYEGRSRASIHNGVIYTVGTDVDSSPTVAEQTQRILLDLEAVLNDAGSGKHRILQATVYLRDMSTKAEMDAVWCEWIGPQENWPQRACIGADLAEEDMVEIVFVAAVE